MKIVYFITLLIFIINSIVAIRRVFKFKIEAENEGRRNVLVIYGLSMVAHVANDIFLTPFSWIGVITLLIPAVIAYMVYHDYQFKVLTKQYWKK